MVWVWKNNQWIPLPPPDEVTVNNEIIWSANTGRSGTGKMIGDVVAEKSTFGISWAGLRISSEYKAIKNGLTAGFYPVKIQLDEEAVELTSYRGTLSARARGRFADGHYYYDSISVELIEQ